MGWAIGYRPDFGLTSSSCTLSLRDRAVGDLGDLGSLKEFMSPSVRPFLEWVSGTFLDLDDARDLPALELVEADLDIEFPGTRGTSSAASLNLFASSRTDV